MSCTVKKALFLNVKLIFQNLGCAICATFTKSVFKRLFEFKNILLRFARFIGKEAFQSIHLR